MYALNQRATMFQGIATLVALALVLWAVGTHMFASTAQAASQNLTGISDLLTDSAPSSTSVHTVTFTTPNGMAIGEIFAIDFPTTGALFDLSSLILGDISMTVGGSGATLGASAGAGQWGVIIGSDYVTFETPTDGGVASSTELIVTLGSTAGTMITNPSATTSYEISVGLGATSSIQDNGQTQVAIIENVYVSANVDTTLAFTVKGTTTGAVCNGAQATFAASTNTTLPFGNLASGVSKTLCQDLTVATNAINGYNVTVVQDQQLQSSTGADIDGFVDGNWTTSPTAWASPTGTVTDENTWGHWGLTSSDLAVPVRTAGPGDFTGNDWVAASTTPVSIMGHGSVADGSTAGIGRASIGYQIEITALQEAGDDYNTTLTYVATPTF